ncbi:hypothetical protein NX773_09150 [Massilia solisilvae]|uniref:Flagellar protein FliT n=1 Tax=Massilia solisilvae TaxID=1811225 RepID=A0ABT2BIJ0_9BURK|nr:hypothetical protein [Massilia solisilvae]MCS0608331.1 hypothetical protein [Massilia solisilvae]
MDRSEAMRALGDELVAAATASDWDRLRVAARALPSALRELAGRGPLTAREREALTWLRSAYEQAQGACARAARDLELRLDDMRNNKEGWIAYALGAENDPALEQP